MIIYEVNLEVDRDIVDAWLPWLHDHVAEMVALEGFSGALVFEVVEPEAAGRCFCCQYQLSSRDALQNYLDHHAERMRAEGQRRFPGGFSAARRILEPVSPELR
ncbi:MAG: DUF4286 family protein [Pseudomonadota bacterium]